MRRRTDDIERAGITFAVAVAARLPLLCTNGREPTEQPSQDLKFTKLGSSLEESR